MKKVFVSGCYDILHAGHIRFFEAARAKGDHLTVCFASDPVLMLAKHRTPSLPEESKKIVLQSLRAVDEVVRSSNLDPIFDFKDHILRIRPDILAITDDDHNREIKQAFCDENGIELVVFSKAALDQDISTTAIISGIKNS